LLGRSQQSATAGPCEPAVRIKACEHPSQKVTILVTGAGGFVGSAVTRELLRRGHEVIAVVRASPISFGSAMVVRQDLLDAQAVMATLCTFCCDAVIHAAANMPLRAQETGYAVNETMTRNLLSGLATGLPKFFLCISSVDVYAQTGGSVDEEAPIAPISDYGASKLATEKACREWATERGVGLGIARLTQIFGPGDRTPKLIPTAIATIKAGQPVKLFGDGEDLRDYLFVTDAARLLAEWTERYLATTLNVATGQTRSINEVLAILREVSGKEFTIERLPRRKSRIDYRFNTTSLDQALGPLKLTPFPMALRKTYDALV
jgi:nucleoside-diphosphate-sugar epimerase